MKTRGIIITGKSLLTKNQTSLDLSGGIDPNSLRKYLVYWDEIHYVDSSFFGGLNTSNPDYKLLLDSDILKNIIIEFPKNFGLLSNVSLASRELSQIDYYKKISKSNKEMLYSIAQSGNILNLPSTDKEKINCIELSIENYLPVPINCQLEDILEFKIKRNAELFAFRDRINEVKKSINSDNFSAENIIHLKEKIYTSLNDIHRVMDENKFQKALSTMKTYLNIEETKATSLILPALGEITGNLIKVPSGYGAVAGLGINVIINLALKKQSKIEALPKETQDFAYLYHMEQIQKT